MSAKDMDLFYKNVWGKRRSKTMEKEIRIEEGKLKVIFEIRDNGVWN